MNTNYKISNFRAFGADGADVKIAPFTVLTGCNSSGKSSIAKSILLLDTFLQKIKSEPAAHKDVFALWDYTMDFSSYPLNLMGRFDKVVNSASTTGEIEYRYTTDNGLEVVLVFISNTSDVLNRGYLKSLTIFKNNIATFGATRVYCSLNTIPFLDEYLENTKNLLNPDCNCFDHFLTGIDHYKDECTHKVSYKTLNWAIDNGSLFNVPLLDVIGHLNKHSFALEIEKVLSPLLEQSDGLRNLIQRITEVFESSECDTFRDFFLICEKNWMSHLSNEVDCDFEDRLIVPQGWAHVYAESSIQDEQWYNLLAQITSGKKSINDAWQKTTIKFPLLLTTLIILGERIRLTPDAAFAEKIKLTNSETWNGNMSHLTVHYLWEDFKKYVNDQVCNALTPSWSGSLAYVGSSRIDVKRLYTLDSKTDFADLLNRYFNARRDFIDLPNSENGKGYEPNAFMNKWLKKFGVCDLVTLDMDLEGLGVAIKLHKGERTNLLADEGYGITQLFSILLEIETGIQRAFQHFLYKGFGHNYMYRTDMRTNKVLFPEMTLIIEEPEIHLHPKFQSLLVDMFAEAKEQYNIHFIIETHSEYFIRRLQLRVAEKKMSADEVSVIYVDDDSHPYNMELKENGKFSRDFGSGFLDEADNTAIQLFDLIGE